MGKIPDDLRAIIADNIRKCRMKKFPKRGGGKKCAEAYGVSPQQWSPWERGMRTPNEERMDDIAKFFGVTVAYLRQDRRHLTLSGSPLDGESHQPPFGGEPDCDSSSLFNDLPQIGSGAQSKASPLTDAAPPSNDDTYWLLAKFFAGVSLNGILIRLAVQDMDRLGDSIAQAFVRNGITFPRTDSIECDRPAIRKDAGLFKRFCFFAVGRFCPALW